MKKISIGLIGAVFAFCLFLPTACQTPAVPINPAERLPGGIATVFNDTPNAFGQPVDALERMDELHFFVGNSFFNQNWVTAPASTTARDGIGPFFNARSCSGCHFKDGRGRPPEFDGETTTGFLVRLSVVNPDGEVVPDPIYGGQLQDRSLEGISPEGTVLVSYEEIAGTFADGAPYSLRRPTYTFVNLAYGEMAENILISPRVANQMIGLGLLEAISAEAILAQADPDDQDGDGISGRPNWVIDTASGETVLGRFGWKANQPNLHQQTADAFLGDMGITTSLHPLDNCETLDCALIPHGGTPEIEDDDLDKVVLYVSTLAVPARPDWDDDTVVQGRELFMQANCSACHTPAWETGDHPTIASLSQQTIFPYTDLLLHDMGEGLADNRPDFEATGREWRTPPLWGLGLIETVNGHTTLLHDGRARNISEAILWHGGEGEASKQAFVNMTAEERDALIRFLESQ